MATGEAIATCTGKVMATGDATITCTREVMATGDAEVRSIYAMLDGGIVASPLFLA